MASTIGEDCGRGNVSAHEVIGMSTPISSPTRLTPTEARQSGGMTQVPLRVIWGVLVATGVYLLGMAAVVDEPLRLPVLAIAVWIGLKWVWPKAHQVVGGVVWGVLRGVVGFVLGAIGGLAAEQEARQAEAQRAVQEENAKREAYFAHFRREDEWKHYRAEYEQRQRPRS